MMNGDPKPKVRCLAALTYGQGHVFGDIHLIRLENVPRAIAIGLTVLGADPHDLIALAAWEKEQQQLRRSP